MEVDALGGVEHEQVGGVGAGLALAGQRGLGRDVDDRALRFAQVRGAAVGELVIVREVAVQRLLEFAPRGVVEVEVVVAVRVVDQTVDMAVGLHHILDDRRDVVGVVEVHQIRAVVVGDGLHFGVELLGGAVVAVDNRHDGPLLGQSQGDALADALETAGEDDDLAFQMQIHDVSVSFVAFVSVRAAAPRRCDQPLYRYRSAASSFMSTPGPGVVGAL